MAFQSDLISEIISNCEGAKDSVKSRRYKCEYDIIRERYDITTQEQARSYHKEMGRYEILSIPSPLEILESIENTILNELVKILKVMFGSISSRSQILVVGLGNRNISADSLGTSIVKKINITHGLNGYPNVMAICPSVLGLTGIETYDIVKSIVDRIKPTHLVLIDSLCAGDESRLAQSIQLSNTGICPGSGIGNKRKCLDGKLAKNVISIGVPLMIYSSTFIDGNFLNHNITIDRLNNIMQKSKKSQDFEEIKELLVDIKNSILDNHKEMIVSIKDIEECVEILSKIISKAINITLGITELK